jgi:hypothetical protein
VSWPVGLGWPRSFAAGPGGRIVTIRCDAVMDARGQAEAAVQVIVPAWHASPPRSARTSRPILVPRERPQAFNAASASAEVWPSRKKSSPSPPMPR